MEGFFGWIFFAAFLYAASGYLYTNGKTYYETCYEYKVEQEKSAWSEPKTTDPYKAAAWKNCELISRQAIFDKGIILSELGKYRDDIILASACPSYLEDMPIAGTYIFTVKLIENAGGPTLLQKYLPASMMISDLYERRWPNCISTRKRLGYSRMTAMSDGSYEFLEKCDDCSDPKTATH